MEKFKVEYDKKKFIDNFAFADKEALRKIIDNLKNKIKDGKIYKGKAGEGLKMYTCRLLLSFALCEVPLTKDDVKVFKVNISLFRVFLNKT